MPAEKRIDAEDGEAYTYEELAAFYKGKYKKADIAAYWETCKPVKKAKGKGKGAAAPEPKTKAKAKAKVKVKAKAKVKTLPIKELEEGSKHFTLDPESEDAKYLSSKIWWFGPKYSPKDVPAFYDVSSLTEDAKTFRKVINIFVRRYKAMGKKGPTHVLGYDARGFIIGPPIALALGIPFVLFRKDQKQPGVLVESSGYSKEYAEKKLDAMCMRMGSIKPGDRVLLIDDLIATGGTALAGFELCNSCGVEVCEFAAVIDLPFCEGVKKIREYGEGRFKDVPVFTLVDGRTIPDENGRDPKKWDEASRVVPAPKAKEMLEKYPELN